MDFQRVGAVFRAVRVSKTQRQVDVARLAKVSVQMVSLIERGHLGRTPLETLGRVAAALDIRLNVTAFWRGGDLERLLNWRHAGLTEALARAVTGIPGWIVIPEASFAIYGERGFIDLLAWHETTRTLLIIEVKTELVDVQETIGIVDRKLRLARRVAAERGWQPSVIGAWLVLAEGATNRRHVAKHQMLLRSAFPADARTMRHWLRRPRGAIKALSFFSFAPASGSKRGIGGPKRVRRAVRPST